MKKPTAKIPKYIMKNAEAEAVFSKLTQPGKSSGYNMGNNASNISDIGNSVLDRIKNNEDITQLFPDVELSIQILTSSILAPNDMLESKLRYVKPELNIPIDINNTILNEIETFMLKEYDINAKLPTIIREALFTKGCYAEAIIPESALDEIINSDIYASHEDMDVAKYIQKSEKSKGLLGSASDKLSTESYTFGNEEIKLEYLENDVLDITDDYTCLVANEVFKRKVNSKIDDIFNISTEANVDMSVKEKMKKLENKMGLDSLFRTTSYKEATYLEVKTSDETIRENVGKPLILKLSPESIIPVHSVNDNTDHLGYFIMLDDNGAPLKNTQKALSNTEVLNGSLNSGSTDNKLDIIKKTQKALKGIIKKDPKLKDIKKIYNTLIENKLKKRLETGVYGSLATLSDADDIYETMLFRALDGKKTKLLYIPKQLLEYFAFDYRDNGTGKSMLEKVTMLFSIRSIILFTKLMANIKNSTTTTEVSAELDDDDIDPDGTKEKIISEAMKTRQTQLPLGVTKIDDLVDWAHKVGFVFKFKHPRLPAMDITTTDTNTSKVIPDDELDNMIQEHIIMSFGLTQELVKSGYDPDFATTVVAKNILLSKRVMQLQNILIPQVQSYTRKIIYNDPRIYNKIKGLIESNYTKLIKNFKSDIAQLGLENKKDIIVDYLTKEYIDNLNVSLPKPEVTDNTNVKDLFGDYSSALDDYLDLVMSSDALPDELIGDMSGKIDGIKVVMKTILIKKWMVDNNYFPEITEFMTRNEEGKIKFDLLDEYQDYTSILSELLIPFFKKTGKFVKDVNKKLDKIDEEGDGTADDTNEDNTGGEDEGDPEGDIPDDTTDAGDTSDDDNTDTGDSGDGDTGDDSGDTEDDLTV